MDEHGGAGEVSVGGLIREARRRAGLSLEALAERAGCGRSHLSQVETGKKHAGEGLLGRLERGLGLPAGHLVERAGLGRAPESVRRRVSDLEARTAAAKRLAGILRQSGIGDDGRLRGSLDVALKSGELRRLVSAIAPEVAEGEGLGGAPDRNEAARAAGRRLGPGERAPVSEAMPRLIPLINRVAAGALTEFTDLGYPARVADEYVRAPDVEDPDAFAARVTGDSMSPEYREGDIVVFSPSAAASSGDDCYVRLEPDHESTFKRVFFEKDGAGREVVRLAAINPAYAGRVVEREAVAGVYPAVSVVRKVRRG